MITSPQIEPVSTDHLLACLGLAIDEAKLVRSIVKSREYASRLANERSAPRKLELLNREIELLEAKLARVRAQAKRA